MKYALCMIGFFLGSLVSVLANPASTRPNIIFLLTDDQRADSLSCAGNQMIKTPNIDQLAADGVRFSNAYVVAPVCMPSRISYLLGQHQRTHKLGFSGGNRTLTEQQWSSSYPALMRGAGYYTGFIGKFGVEKYAFKGHADEKFDYWRAHDGWAKFYPKGLKNTTIYDTYKSDFITPIMGECMAEFLDTVPEDKPFCLSVSFSAPHASTATSMCEEGGWFMDQPANADKRIAGHSIYGDLYRDLSVVLPSTMDGHPERYLPKHVMDEENGRKKCYAYAYSPKNVTEHHYRYAQLITGIDAQVGHLVEILKAKGLFENTILVYSADNGLLMGDYNQGGKGLLYDLTCKVPLIVFDPRLPKAQKGQVIDQFMLSIDVAPSLLHYAGIKIPATMQGQLMQPVIENPETGRQEILLESLFGLRGNPQQEGLRSERWKYVKFHRSPVQAEQLANGEHRFQYADADLRFESEPIYEQLFDMQNDPGEIDNLASNPEYQVVLNRMRSRLSEKSKALNERKKGHEKD
jgi:arylsulfatase A-like enzyme